MKFVDKLMKKRFSSVTLFMFGVTCAGLGKGIPIWTYAICTGLIILYVDVLEHKLKEIRGSNNE